MASGCNKGWTNIWSIDERVPLCTHPGNSLVVAVDWFNTNNSVIITHAHDKHIKILKLENLKELKILGLSRVSLKTNKRSILSQPYVRKLIYKLPEMLLCQYQYETSSVVSGIQLQYSLFMHTLLAIAVHLRLDRLKPEIEFLSSVACTVRCAEALARRRELPKELGENFKNIDWSLKQDEEAMAWLTSQPADWQEGGACDVYVWGSGRHGQLGDVGRSAILEPIKAESFGTCQTVICGQNCTFVIGPGGNTVLACGEGSKY